MSTGIIAYTRATYSCPRIRLVSSNGYANHFFFQIKLFAWFVLFCSSRITTVSELWSCQFLDLALMTQEILLSVYWVKSWSRLDNSWASLEHNFSVVFIFFPWQLTPFKTLQSEKDTQKPRALSQTALDREFKNFRYHPNIPFIFQKIDFRVKTLLCLLTAQ